MMVSLSELDPSSFSRPDECVVTKLHLDLDVDFAESVLRGSVRVSAKKVLSSAQRLILDTRDLKINSVTNVANNSELKYSIDAAVKSFGSPMVIDLSTVLQNEFDVNIKYETSPSASALQWLKPEQTCGKKHPYLFSQCQAIHARSMVPCQDSPGVKMPYSATVSAPKELVALMSSLRKGAEPCTADKQKTVHRFDQPVPIPSYLIAIVVGDLVSKDIGPRSKVWSEKEMIDASAAEFDETDKMLTTAEQLMGPYVWGIYDLLVLPPSFPYGGMENPCLTFVTPTCISGDKSLAFVVAHEVTHSWTGNLVTNKNPEHFWLNEGHTVFVERKIAGRMFGENLRQFLALHGWTELRNQIDRIEYTELVPKLTGIDPDDAFSIVPYEKGSTLLMYLEQKLGGPEVFEPFLKAYIEKFKYKSITTDDWKSFLYEFFDAKKAILDQIEWDAWLFAKGMPPVKPTYDKTLSNACLSLAGKWSKASNDLSEFKDTDIKEFSAFQKVAFLASLLDQAPLSVDKITKMKELYQFDQSQNAEIKFRWLRLGIRARDETAIEPALKFVAEQGRLKFVRPLYKDLYEWDKSRQQAQDNYTATRVQMHPLTATMLGKDLHLVEAQ